MPIGLVRPAREHLAGYLDALTRGWPPDNHRPEEARAEHLAAIAQDAEGFLAGLDDPEAKGGPIPLPDGSFATRLPGFHRWIWDGEFCGGLGFRWQQGTAALPPLVLGHIGYSVVPWRRRERIATQALALLLAEVQFIGLPYVELTCKPDNSASIAVIKANGGVLAGPFARPAEMGGGTALRWRIALG